MRFFRRCLFSVRKKLQYAAAWRYAPSYSPAELPREATGLADHPGKEPDQPAVRAIWMSFRRLALKCRPSKIAG
jgi:hypothetical protein